MASSLQNKRLKSFNVLTIGLFVSALLGCGAMSGSSNQADGGGGVQGMALDDIAQNGAGAGLGGVGSGGAMTGGGLPGIDPRDGAGGGVIPPAGGGGPSDPFSDVGGGGSSGHASGSGGECSGGVCSGDTPVGNLFGSIKISVKLHFSPENPNGDCNTLLPPKVEREVCGFGEYHSQPNDGLFSNLWIREAKALPAGGRDIMVDPTKAVICGTETVQPPMDSNSVPKVAVEALRPFYSYSSEIYRKTLIASCGTDGKWLAETENIRVPFSPYPDGNNTWDFKVDALFPQEGSWVLRGTRNLKIKCSWEPHPTETRIKCEEQVVLPTIQGEATFHPLKERL